MFFISLYPSHDSLLQRYGFNSDGHETVRQNLRKFNKMLKSLGSDEKIVVGVNLGKNKSSPEDSFDDYLHGLKAFAEEEAVDYFVINISSPNTPGLRMLQKGDSVRNLLHSLSAFKDQHQLKKPVLLKISPDLSEDERSHVCQVVMSVNKKNQVIDGIIVSNTTTTRPESLTDAKVSESGGLSGAPLRSLSTDAIRHVYKLTNGTIPIIGVGGIFTGEDALEKVKAGASLLQIYTSLALEGPPVVFTIQRDLARLLRYVYSVDKRTDLNAFLNAGKMALHQLEKRSVVIIQSEYLQGFGTRCAFYANRRHSTF